MKSDRQEGFLRWTKLLSMAWLETTRIFFREGLREMEGHLRLSNNDTSNAKIWFRAAMQAAVGNRSAAEGSFLEHPRSRQNTQGNADSLLSLVEITGDFDVKDHSDGNHFLASEVQSRVAVRPYLNRKNKNERQVKWSWKCNTVHAQGQHSEYRHRALLQSKVLGPVCEQRMVCWYACMQFVEDGKRRESVQVVVIGVVKSVQSCKGIYFPFLYLQTFLSAFQQLVRLFPLRVSWAWIGHSSFLVVTYFLPFSLPKKKCLNMSLMMFVFGCVQKLPSEIGYVFFCG